MVFDAAGVTVKLQYGITSTVVNRVKLINRTT